jgi:polyhydroxybutyrate depolymerase
MSAAGFSPGPTLSVAPGTVALTILSSATGDDPEDVAQIWGPGYYDFFFQQQPMAGGANTIRYAEFTIPTTAKLGVPLPVVLALHGGGGIACLMRHKTGFDELANKYGFIVMYLAGTGPQSQIQWELYFNPGVYPFLTPGTDAFDDVAYTRIALGRLAQYVAIDTNRIYAAGFSNGGAMCHKLAADMAGGDGFRVAAIAASAGHHAPQQFTPTGPISVMQISGIDDPVAPFEGGAGGAVGPIFSSVTYPKVGTGVHGWKDNLGVQTKLKTRRTLTGSATAGNAVAQFHRWSEDPHDPSKREVMAVVGHWEHAWPGGQTATGEVGSGGLSTNTFNASEEIWAFLKEKSLTAA